MNRRDLKRLSTIRAKEAKALLDSGYYDGTYYLVGYSVECGLKACIAKGTRRYDFPDKRTVQDSYVHDLEKLIKVAGLQGQLTIELNRDPRFESNWLIVKDWTEESRYGTWTEVQARGLYIAATERRHGVLRWVKQHW